MNTTTKRRTVLVVSAVAAATALTLTAGAMTGYADPFSDTDPVAAPIPEYDYDDTARSFVVEADFGATTATPTAVVVGMQRARTHIGDPALLELRLEGNAGDLVDSIDAWDPRWVFEETETGGERRVIRPGPGILTVPFDADAETMVVNDLRAGTTLAEIDLAPAVRQYCLEHPEDAQCVEADLAVTAIAADGVGFSVVGATTSFEVATEVENLGPDGPVDAVVEETVTAGPGVIVAPASASWDADALAVGAPREHTGSYDITCAEPGVHTVTIAAAVAPVLAKVADPDPANDQASTDFSIDCAVPVKLDIKPGSVRNPVNVKEASIPMAVLTTAAGEFGLPLAFDATAIDADSVRIGDRDPLITSADGVPERHGKVHLEDVTTADGDRDAMLHAAGRDIPVRKTTTELCVRGTTADGLSFFGCDAVDVVP
ncbi:hypothetical protein ACFT30_01515 [Microbacterium ureisolvens]|uniref:hypothetical protein n=1 Tax=Microbacterium ureisolvens TaxID=2781186 RepID=UPI0036435814